MSKAKRNIKKVSVVENNNVVTEAPAPRYKMIPVDPHTHARLMTLCSEYGFGQRGQGAMVRKLINSEFEKILSKLPASKL